MANLTERDKRAIRFGAIALAVCFVVFFGSRTFKAIERSRGEYKDLLVKAQREELELINYETRLAMFEKLRDTYRLDPRSITNETVAAETSAAIQAAARQGGFKLGPMRETAGRSSARELASIQFEGVGPLHAALALIHRIQTLGYPLVIDSVQLTQEGNRPGTLKLNATVIILNFERWKQGDQPDA
jgi:hypothetical protein